MRERILEASAGRDRVVDAVKALALALVILGHALAWTLLPGGGAVNTLEQAPGLYPLTWVLQILPLFFLLAGAGLVRYARQPSSAGLLARVDRLVAPTLPLLGVSLVLSAILEEVAGADIGEYAGILPIQLTWFIGVYLLVIVVAPLLARLHAVGHFAAFLLAIAAVDALRVNVDTQLGWVNLLLVWAYFAALGMHLPRLRQTSRWAWALVAAGSAALAVAAVAVGPYSVALVTTTALPGLSNLAPPTIVLALAGTTQVAVLLLAWPALDRLLAHDRVWIPVAVFSFRAMGLYLWHMLLLSLCIAAVMLTQVAPPALSASWWALHAVVLLVVAAGVWLLAPVMLRLADRLAALLARLVPPGAAGAAARAPVAVTAALAAGGGVAFMLLSESGLSTPLDVRTVLGLPYLPAVALILLAAMVALARRAKGRPA